MSRKTVKIMGTVVLTALWSAGQCSGRTCRPPPRSRPRSPGVTAIEKAAKDNKYLFIFFWRRIRNKAASCGAPSTRRRRKWPIRPTPSRFKSPTRRKRPSWPATTSAARRCRWSWPSPPTAPSPRPLPAHRGGPASPSLCQPLHGRVHEGPPGAEARAALRSAGAAAGPARWCCPRTCSEFTADKEYAKKTKVVVLNLGDAAETDSSKSLQVDPQSVAPVTVMMAPPAAVIGTMPTK